MRTVFSLCTIVFLTYSATAQDRYTVEVRPILAQHCFKCHGPDDKARKGKLRLDLRDEAIKPARSGNSPIVPGKPDESQLLKRIHSTDETELMPPPSAKNPLTKAQKESLKKWIEEGAPYASHWAFAPPKQPALSAVKNKEWPRNGIDHFVLARLEKEGMKPSSPAEKLTLVRRVYLDLIGLPPTPAEADAFVKNEADDAYEKLVDKLLANPAYGELWARRWLDLARYADTNGYEKDRQRSIWPYRDWVIDAINKDMPFDQFTIEQLAGDMLKDAMPQQRIATGFHRNTMLNEEGGIDPLEFRFHAMTDRVATTGTVWLGLTIGCAQCHSHKYDPISHREYYQLFAFLNNADEPDFAVPNADIAKRRKEIQDKIDAQTAALLKKVEPSDAKFQAWLKAERARTVKWTVLRPTEARANLPLLTVQDDASILASGDQSKRDLYTLKFKPATKDIRAIRLEVVPDDRLPKHGPGRVFYEGPVGDFFLSEVTVLVNDKKTGITHAGQSYGGGGSTAALAIDGDPQTGWSINGGQGRQHTAVFHLGQPLNGEFTLTLLFEKYFAAGLGRFRISVTDADNPATTNFPADVEQALLGGGKDKGEALIRYYVQASSDLAKERMEIDKLRQSLPAFPTTLVMQERPASNPRPTYLHHRGEFLQPTDKVDPGVPAVLPALPKDATADRLTFARWLVSPDNPLVGRVTMNRQWAAFFGRGLVRTQQDFGLQGELPSHPDLLDWLAVELVKQKWSIKRMHKLIVMSATYRQSSKVTPGLLVKDPENVLLARGPKLRLEAEQLRDSLLSSSGLLTMKQGGPSVFPPQPPGITTEGAYGKLDWKPSEGPDRYRRGLYTFSKRTAPYAMFATLDGPSGEVCTFKREVTNTALQALTMLNDAVILEAAQALGRRMTVAKGTVEERVTDLFRRCLTRPPLPEERKLLVAFYEAQLVRLVKKELDAAALAGPGSGDVNERAAWTALARVLFNLDEAITRN